MSTEPNQRVFDSRRKVTVAEGLAKLPGANGERYVELFNHGSLTVELYAPRDRDPQQPHTRDEAYIVVQGQGEFVNGNQFMGFQPGDLLFAAAGEVHRFQNFTPDLIVWVIFYGPHGGEK